MKTTFALAAFTAGLGFAHTARTITLPVTQYLMTAMNYTDCAVSFEVSALVNSWISGSNAIYAIALTAKNDLSGGDFLHGFVNNDNDGALQGTTYLTVTAVPEPETYAALLAGLVVTGWTVRRNQRNQKGAAS